jgi:hypothetical protein
MDFLSTLFLDGGLVFLDELLFCMEWNFILCSAIHLWTFNPYFSATEKWSFSDDGLKVHISGADLFFFRASF